PTSIGCSTWPAARPRWGRPSRSSPARRSAVSTGCRSRCCAPPTDASWWSGRRRPHTSTDPVMCCGEVMGAHLSFDLFSDVHQLLAYQFMVNALQAAGVVAAMAAVVGWFMVLRAETFAGHTLSLMSFPGAAAAALAGLPLAVGYFAFCVAGALALAGPS